MEENNYQKNGENGEEMMIDDNNNQNMNTEMNLEQYLYLIFLYKIDKNLKEKK
jgi:hypothetical protein